MGSVSTMISAKCLKNAIISGSNNICLKKSAIDDLNIFPVPDGDTGTNMSMTIAAAAEALENVRSQNISEVASIAASAMLKGARGNSGVILSLLFRGIATDSGIRLRLTEKLLLLHSMLVWRWLIRQ